MFWLILPELAVVGNLRRCVVWKKLTHPSNICSSRGQWFAGSLCSGSSCSATIGLSTAHHRRLDPYLVRVLLLEAHVPDLLHDTYSRDPTDRFWPRITITCTTCRPGPATWVYVPEAVELALANSSSGEGAQAVRACVCVRARLRCSTLLEKPRYPACLLQKYSPTGFCCLVLLLYSFGSLQSIKQKGYLDSNNIKWCSLKLLGKFSRYTVQYSVLYFRYTLN